MRAPRNASLQIRLVPFMQVRLIQGHITRVDLPRRLGFDHEQGRVDFPGHYTLNCIPVYYYYTFHQMISPIVLNISFLQSRA